MAALLLWPLAVAQLGPRILHHLAHALTRTQETRPE